MIQYKENPFYLTDEQVEWVEDTYASMSKEEKIGQLFCPIVFTMDEQELKELVEGSHIGGMLYLMHLIALLLDALRLKLQHGLVQQPGRLAGVIHALDECFKIKRILLFRHKLPSFVAGGARRAAALGDCVPGAPRL